VVIRYLVVGIQKRYLLTHKCEFLLLFLGFFLFFSCLVGGIYLFIFYFILFFQQQSWVWAVRKCTVCRLGGYACTILVLINTLLCLPPSLLLPPCTAQQRKLGQWVQILLYYPPPPFLPPSPNSYTLLISLLYPRVSFLIK